MPASFTYFLAIKQGTHVVAAHQRDGDSLEVHATGQASVKVVMVMVHLLQGILMQINSNSGPTIMLQANLPYADLAKRW